MSSTVTVYDTHNVQRRISVTPGMSLLDVLRRALDASRTTFESGRYALQVVGRKPLDLTMPFRLSGIIPSTQKLEIIDRGSTGTPTLATLSTRTTASASAAPPTTTGPTSTSQSVPSSESVIGNAPESLVLSTDGSSVPTMDAPRAAAPSDSCALVVQLETGERVDVVGDARWSLWELLEHLQRQFPERCLIRANADLSTGVVECAELQIMQCVYRGTDRLRAVTLADVIVADRAKKNLVRVFRILSNTARNPVSSEISNNSNSSESNSSTTTAASVSSTDQTVISSHSSTTDSSSAATSPSSGPDSRPWVIVRPSDNLATIGRPSTATTTTTPTTADDEDDSFFEVTAEDVRIMYHSMLRQQRERDVMMTSAMREAEREKRRRKYAETLIRIRFADGIIAQQYFPSAAIVSDLYKSVRSILRNPDELFSLYTSPPLRHLTADLYSSTLQSVDLVPAAIVNLSCKSGPTKRPIEDHWLSDEALATIVAPSEVQSCAIPAPVVIPVSSSSLVDDIRDPSSAAAAAAAGPKTCWVVDETVAGSGDSGSSSSSKPSIPKWLKLGK